MNDELGCELEYCPHCDEGRPYCFVHGHHHRPPVADPGGKDCPFEPIVMELPRESGRWSPPEHVIEAALLRAVTADGRPSFVEIDAADRGVL